MKTQQQIRDAFWRDHPQFKSLRRARKRQNDYPADVRMAWVDYMDWIRRDGQISRKLAGKATL
jgi:hypothetical protein